MAPRSRPAKADPDAAEGARTGAVIAAGVDAASSFTEGTRLPTIATAGEAPTDSSTKDESLYQAEAAMTMQANMNREGAIIDESAPRPTSTNDASITLEHDTLVHEQSIPTAALAEESSTPFETRVSFLDPDIRSQEPPSRVSPSQQEQWAADDGGRAQEFDGVEEQDEDGGIIRCICDCDDDDGFTIQCDNCLVWQHCACFGMSQASVPDEYRCEQCDPRPVDVAYAKEHQRRRREAETRRRLLQRTARRQSVPNSGAQHEQSDPLRQTGRGTDETLVSQHDSISVEQTPRSRNASHQNEGHLGSPSHERSPSATTPGATKSSHRKRQSTSHRPSSRRGEGVGGRNAASLARDDVQSVTSTTQQNLSRDDLNDSFDSALEQTEAWHVEYTQTSENLVVEDNVAQTLSALLSQSTSREVLIAEPGTGSRMIAPVSGKRVKTLANIIAHEAAREGDAEDDLSKPNVAQLDPWNGAGLSAIGNECKAVELSAPSLAACAQKTYVRQISELASAGIFNSLLHISRLPNEPQRSSSANRMFSRPVMHGLFADASIPAGCFVCELTGELISADKYREDPINQYRLIGVSKPAAHLLPPPLNICIDARRFGNHARFARSSCHPNAVIRPILFRKTAETGGPTSELDDKTILNSDVKAEPTEDAEAEIAFGIFAISDIAKSHEITLGWEWDDQHIVHLLPKLVRNPMIGVLNAPELAPPSDPRTWDREQRNNAIGALVEKGDFPYAGASFSHKMNEIMTVLLSSSLCACIGSAAAGGGSASSNNVKRQDCAIVQMLRLSQGMALLNVTLPTAKANRKTRLPDFEPLVGKARGWRPIALPPSPPSSLGSSAAIIDPEHFYSNLRVPFKLATGGKVGRVSQDDFDRAINGHLTGSETDRFMKEEDAASDVSSATDVLSERSDDEVSDEDVVDEREGGVSIMHRGDKPFLVRKALPPKKRVSGTRLKAVSPDFEGSDVEYRGKKQRKISLEKALPQDNRRQVPRRRVPVAYHNSNDEIQDRRKFSSRRRGTLVEPSSPLSTAPSSADEGEDSGTDDEEDSGEEDDDEDIGVEPPENSRKEGELDKGRPHTLKRKREARDRPTPSRGHRKKQRDHLDFSDSDDPNEISDDDGDASTHDAITEEGQDVRAVFRQLKKKQVAPSDDDSEKEDPKREDTTIHFEPTDAHFEREIGTENIYEAQQEQMAAPQLPLAPPPPPIEMPRAKLSLADYKKRLAERRTTSSAAPLGSPSAGTQGLSQPETPVDTPLSASAAGGFNFPAPTPPESLQTPIVVKSEFIAPSPISTPGASQGAFTTVQDDKGAIFSSAQPLSSAGALSRGFPPLSTEPSRQSTNFPQPSPSHNTMTGTQSGDGGSPSKPPYFGDNAGVLPPRGPKAQFGSASSPSLAAQTPTSAVSNVPAPHVAAAAPEAAEASQISMTSRSSFSAGNARPSPRDWRASHSFESPAPSVSDATVSPSRPQSTSMQPPSSVLTDFANVPKGPARMRERERERERDRERDGPPSRWSDFGRIDRERDRDRDRGYSSRSAESLDDRPVRDAYPGPRRDDRLDRGPSAYHPPHPAMPLGRPGPFGGRGGPPGYIRGGPPGAGWGGRARTRGRGSRGGWR